MGAGGDGRTGAALAEVLQPLLETCRLCEAGGLHYTITQTFGGPGETRDTVEQKVAFLQSLNPRWECPDGVSILPGTAVAAKALEEGPRPYGGSHPADLLSGP